MEKLKPCPCGCNYIELKKYPLWNGTHGYYGSYQFLIECANPNCYWKFCPPNNNTIYQSEEEAKRKIIIAWNNRGCK